MSNPNIPNITPTITLSRDDAVNLLFSSIAMEELGLARILNAEGEQIQFALGILPGTGATRAIEFTSTMPISTNLAALGQRPPL